MSMLTRLLQVAILGSKRVTSLVLFGWQALFYVLDLHKGISNGNAVVVDRAQGRAVSLL